MQRHPGDSDTSADPRDLARVTASRPPAPGRILGWVYLAQVLLAALLFAHAPWESAPEWTHPLSVLVLPLAVLVAGVSFWHTHLRGGRANGAFFYGQLVFASLLLTLLVFLTGGQQSLFAPFYILVICAAALLLPAPGGVVVGLLSILLYVGSVLAMDEGELGSPVLFQIALFGVVALVTGYLGERLRAAGTALGEVETELRQLRLDTGDILNTVSTGVLTVDGGGRLAYLNPAAEEILALSAEEWVGQPILERLDGIAPGLGGVIERSAREGIAVRRFETTPVAEDAFILGVSTTLVDRASDQPPAVTAIFQDITEKMRAEALRRRAERLEAVAELSASLAHEIKNPLASIRSAAEQISDRSMDEEDAALLRALVVRESDRLSRLLTEFIDFARVKVTEPRPVDLPAVVRNVVQLARAHPDAHSRELHFADSTPESVHILGAEDLLHRAIFNLVLNGLQWAGEGGRVSLMLDEVRSDLLSPALGAHSIARLTVADSGPGVPEEFAEQIFNPFFTRRTGGTGLGLALVQRAVEAHGGAIFVDNAPASSGMGATFTLYLPLLPADVAAPSDPQPEATSFP